MDVVDPGIALSDGAALSSVYLELSDFFPSAASLIQSGDGNHRACRQSTQDQVPEILNVRGGKVFDDVSSLPQESAYLSSSESSSSDGSSRVRRRSRRHNRPSKEPYALEGPGWAPSQPHESLLHASSQQRRPALPETLQRSAGSRKASLLGVHSNSSPALHAEDQSSSSSSVADSHSQVHLSRSSVSPRDPRRHRSNRHGMAEDFHDDDESSCSSSRERAGGQTSLDARPLPTSTRLSSRLDYFVHIRARSEGGGFSRRFPTAADNEAAAALPLPASTEPCTPTAPQSSVPSSSGTRRRRGRNEQTKKRRRSQAFGRSSWAREQGSQLLRNEVARSARAAGTKMVADYGWAALHVLLSICVALLALHFAGGAEHMTRLVFLELRLLAGLGVAVVLIFSLELYHALQPLFPKRSHRRLQGSEDGKESSVEKGHSRKGGGASGELAGSRLNGLLESQRRLGGDLHPSLSLQSSLELTEFSLDVDEEGGSQHRRPSPHVVGAFENSPTSSSIDTASDGDSQG